jgi:2-isopropylmalate synthase
MRRIQIFDTTLRDGEQSPGVALHHGQKLEIAHQLAHLGVDVIEAGFPISSPGDAEGVARIAREVRGVTIAALARAAKTDIEVAARALEAAEHGRIHVFIATSPIHMAKKLQLSPEAVIDRAVQAVTLAKQLAAEVEFSAEDASRSELDFLIQIFRAAAQAGASVLNAPDTVGYATPREYGELIGRLCAALPESTLSAHCHDDLGLAVANSLAAIEAGAGQLECTVNGIGERAGNASLEEIVMALHTRRDSYPMETGVNTRELYRSSRLVSRLTGMLVQPNKAVVGDNAFAHESGIHQDGVIKARETYEIMNADLVGREAAVLVLGKHSGRAAFRKAVVELGYNLSEERIAELFGRFKDLADRKGQIHSEDLRALIDAESEVPQHFVLESLQVLSGTHVTPMATVRLRTPQGIRQAAATGDGPVEATFLAISQLSELELELEAYRIQSVTRGGDALGEVSVTARHRGALVSGIGLATDVVEASARAWIQALNQVVGGSRSLRPAEPTP